MPPDLIFFMGSIPSLGKLVIDEAGKNTLSLKQNNSLYLYYLFCLLLFWFLRGTVLFFLYFLL